jgi:hypothetical protein
MLFLSQVGWFYVDGEDLQGMKSKRIKIESISTTAWFKLSPQIDSCLAHIVCPDVTAVIGPVKDQFLRNIRSQFKRLCNKSKHKI